MIAASSAIVDEPNQSPAPYDTIEALREKVKFLEIKTDALESAVVSMHRRAQACEGARHRLAKLKERHVRHVLTLEATRDRQNAWWAREAARLSRELEDALAGRSTLWSKIARFLAD